MKMIKDGFSIIICCYNSASRLPDTLKAISRLTRTCFSFEVIVVDNCSSDNTREVTSRTWKKLECDNELRVVFENKPGLNFARERGMQEASYEYILFCDDDNWLDKEYLMNAYRIMSQYTDVGILGGQGIAVPEIEPPFWFEDVKSAYAVGKKDDPEGYLDKRESFIAGAGMVLRKVAWDKVKSTGFQSLLSDRKGKELSSAGDLEFSYVAKMAGYKLYYSESLVFSHFISKERLTWNYILRGCKGYGKAVNVIDAYLYVMQDRVKSIEDTKRNFNLGLMKNIAISFMKVSIVYLPVIFRSLKYTHEEIAFHIKYHQLKTTIKYWVRGEKLLPRLIQLKESLGKQRLMKV